MSPMTIYSFLTLATLSFVTAQIQNSNDTRAGYSDSSLTGGITCPLPPIRAENGIVFDSTCVNGGSVAAFRKQVTVGEVLCGTAVGFEAALVNKEPNAEAPVQGFVAYTITEECYDGMLPAGAQMAGQIVLDGPGFLVPQDRYDLTTFGQQIMEIPPEFECVPACLSVILNDFVMARTELAWSPEQCPGTFSDVSLAVQWTDQKDIQLQQNQNTGFLSFQMADLISMIGLDIIGVDGTPVTPSGDMWGRNPPSIAVAVTNQNYQRDPEIDENNVCEPYQLRIQDQEVAVFPATLNSAASTQAGSPLDLTHHLGQVVFDNSTCLYCGDVQVTVLLDPFEGLIETGENAQCNNIQQTHVHFVCPDYFEGHDVVQAIPAPYGDGVFVKSCSAYDSEQSFVEFGGHKDYTVIEPRDGNWMYEDGYKLAGYKMLQMLAREKLNSMSAADEESCPFPGDVETYDDSCRGAVKELVHTIANYMFTDTFPSDGSEFDIIIQNCPTDTELVKIVFRMKHLMDQAQGDSERFGSLLRQNMTFLDYGDPKYGLCPANLPAPHADIHGEGMGGSWNKGFRVFYSIQKEAEQESDSMKARLHHDWTMNVTGTDREWSSGPVPERIAQGGRWARAFCMIFNDLSKPSRLARFRHIRKGLLEEDDAGYQTSFSKFMDFKQDLLEKGEYVHVDFSYLGKCPVADPIWVKNLGMRSDQYLVIRNREENLSVIRNSTRVWDDPTPGGMRSVIAVNTCYDCEYFMQWHDGNYGNHDGNWDQNGGHHNGTYDGTGATGDWGNYDNKASDGDAWQKK